MTATTNVSQYAQLLEAVGDAVIVIDARHRIIRFNTEAEHVFGYAKAEVLGQPVNVLLPEGYRQNHDRNIAAFATEPVQRRPKSERAEVRGRRKNGVEFDAEITIAKVKIRGELQFMAVVRDVSDRKQMERNLQSTAQHLKQAQQVAHLGSWEINLLTGDVVWSAQTYEMLGVDPASSPLNRDRFLAMLHPEDRALILKRFDEAIASRTATMSSEMRLTRADGVQRTLRGALEFVWGENGQLLRLVAILQDVTEKRAVANRVRLVAERLERAQELTKLGSWKWNPHTNRVVWSNELYRLLGLEPGSITPFPASFRLLVHPDDLARDEASGFDPLAQAAAAPGKPIEPYEFRFLRADGAERWAQGRLQAYLGPDGQVARFEGTIQDITERLAAAERLRQSEHLLNRAQELADLGSWEHNEVTGEIVWSRNFFKLLGLDPEAHRPSNELFWSIIHPDDRAMVQDRYREALSNRDRSATYHTRIIRGDGAERVLHDTVEYYRLSDGRLWRVTGISQDVTERMMVLDDLQRSERMLEQAQRLSRSGSWEIDLTTGILRWSTGYYELFGLDPGQHSPDARLSLSLIHPDDRARVARLWEQARTGGDATKSIEYRIVRPDGAELPVRAIGGFMQDETGRPNRIVGWVQDITEERATEEALQAALTVAEAGNRAKSEFLANMSHELRTPLNAIIGFSELLSMGGSAFLTPDRRNEYLRDIYNSGQHLLEIINGILSLSKAEAGETVLDEKIFDLPDVVGWTFDLMAEQARAAAVELRLEVELGLPNLFADMQLLRQALLNLVANAIKFSHAGGAVRVRVWQSDRGDLVITIADSGIGMEPQDVAVALTPFGQVDSTLQRRYEGTGLGLPLAKKFIKLHGGELMIDSTPGIGTTVTVTLPQSRCRPAAAT